MRSLGYDEFCFTNLMKSQLSGWAHHSSSRLLALGAWPSMRNNLECKGKKGSLFGELLLSSSLDADARLGALFFLLFSLSSLVYPLRPTTRKRDLTSRFAI